MSYVESIALKSHRKRVGLIQEDMAILIGVQSASQVSRHESSEREPDLRTAIAYSIVFDVSLRELLPKLFREIAGEVNARANRLISEIGSSDDKLHQDHRLEVLRRVSARIEMYEFTA
jgi:transcriptional regulator with XRE-family HTH domain